MSLYFVLLAASIFVPIVLSFDKRLQFYKQWPVVLPSIVLVGALYISFDILLTKNQVWGFNPKYLSRIYVFNLPLEECLFFFVIPYASLFLHYSVMEYFPTLKPNKTINKFIILFFIVFSGILAVLHFQKQYTFYIFVKLLAAFLLVYLFKPLVTRSFFISFLLILVPFLIVNGILTGSFIPGEVVWYNNNENLGLRVFTIPVEDFAYAFSLLLYNLLFIELFKKLKYK